MPPPFLGDWHLLDLLRKSEDFSKSIDFLQDMGALKPTLITKLAISGHKSSRYLSEFSNSGMWYERNIHVPIAKYTTKCNFGQKLDYSKSYESSLKFSWKCNKIISTLRNLSSQSRHGFWWLLNFMQGWTGQPTGFRHYRWRHWWKECGCWWSCQSHGGTGRYILESMEAIQEFQMILLLAVASLTVSKFFALVAYYVRCSWNWAQSAKPLELWIAFFLRIQATHGAWNVQVLTRPDPGEGARRNKTESSCTNGSKKATTKQEKWPAPNIPPPSEK